MLGGKPKNQNQKQKNQKEKKDPEDITFTKEI